MSRKATNSLPLFERLQIESQSHCNRSCWFCPRSYDRSGTYLSAQGDAVINRMPTEKILDLLDQACALGFNGRVAFHNYSEPLLDKRNIELARAAATRGLEPYLHTNGDVLRENEALCKEVIEVYHLVVIGLYEYLTSDELAAEKHYWTKKLPIAQLEFSAIGPLGSGAGRSMGVPRALVPTDSRMAIPDMTYIHASCHRPLIRMIIRYDGEMCNCCEDTFGAFDLGNVYEKSLQELWYSDTHVRIIKDLLAGEREKHSLCNRCPMSPSGQAPASAPINIAPRHVTEDEIYAWSATKLNC